MGDIKKIVILGTGYAGVRAAKLLNKKFKKDDTVEITLIGKDSYHTLMTELHEVATRRIEAESAQISLKRIFGGRKVKLVNDTIKNIDFDKKKLISEDASYDYDYLVLGSGSEPAFFGVPGVKENAFTLWSLKDALRIREHIEYCFKKASLETNPKKKQELLTFTVAGAGFTGIETIGELVEWKKKLCRAYDIEFKEVKLVIVEALDKILPILHDNLIIKAEKYLTKKGVQVIKSSPIIKVNKNSIELKNGTEISTKTLIWTCGVQANQFTKDLGLTLNRAGRIQTNEFMQSVDHKDVYVVGDTAFYEENEGKALPQIVETATQTAKIAVENIVSDIKGNDKKAFKSNYHGLLVSIGSKYAVASLMGVSLSGFIAMAIKHLANLHYLLGVGGFSTVWSYLVHEFFDIKERRSMLGGHLSSKANRLWLLPLRLFIGCIWVLEGLKKLFGEGTWAQNGFSSIAKGIGPDSWIKAGNMKMPFDWLIAAGSGASEQVAEGAALPVPILKQMPGFYRWIMSIMIPNADIAIWFQRMVVAMELGIGLALLVGLFTFIASAASAFLAINFILSAMGEWSILWHFFGAIALMTGAGRVLGLDYYVMPWLKRHWNKTNIAKRTYLFIDSEI